MCIPKRSHLVTFRYGLASRLFLIPASPSGSFRDRGISSAPRRRGSCAAASGFSEHSQPKSDIPGGRRRWWHQEDSFRMAGVETGRSHPHQQSLEEQNGKRHPETTRKRRSVHNVSLINRASDRSNRLLVVRQLLVPRTRGSRDDRSLTNSETTPKSRHPDQRGECLIVFFNHEQTVVSRKRLASSRTNRWRLDEPLTSRQV